MKKIKVNDVELAYRDEGSGKPIVFLHAFPLNQTMWDEQVGNLLRAIESLHLTGVDLAKAA